MVSNFSANKLCEYLVDIDKDVERFLFHADNCINRIREEITARPEHVSQSQMRLERLKQAFDALTDQDRESLNFAAEITLLSRSNPVDIELRRMMNEHSLPLCEAMEKALEYPASSTVDSTTRVILTEFARKAVSEGWVDVSVNNTNLIALLLIMMEETGVKHDADAIARDAMSRVMRP